MLHPLHPVGPVSNYVTGRQNVMNFLIPSHRPSMANMPRAMEILHPGETRYARFLSGFCVMLPRAVLDTVGLLEETTELGADDLEMSWRLQVRGFRLAIAADVFVYHEGHTSFAALAPGEAQARIAASDAALYAKMATFYAPGKVPPARVVWGNDLFTPAMARLSGKGAR